MRYTRTVGDMVETFEADTLEGVKELMTLSEWVPEVGGQFTCLKCGYPCLTIRDDYGRWWLCSACGGRHKIE